MTTLALSDEQRAVARRVRWCLFISWVALACAVKLSSTLQRHDWPFLGQLVLFGTALLLARWRRRMLGYPRPPLKPLTWRSWGLWLFLGWASLIFFSGFYLSPEHHRYTWIPLLCLFGTAFVLIEIYTFWAAGKPARTASGSQETRLAP